MSEILELGALNTKVSRLARIVQGDADEGAKGLQVAVIDIERELDKQKDENQQGTMAYRIRVMETERRDQKILIRGLLIGLGIIGAGGGILQGVILNVLRELANRGV